MDIFQACDIRGVYPRDLAEAEARQIGYAAGIKLAGGRVVVGGDVRLSTPRLKAALAGALAEAGCKVLDIGTVPTPVLHFAINHCRADGGVMVTASHNPAEYNGFKLVFGGDAAAAEALAELKRLYRQKRRPLRRTGAAKAAGTLQTISIIPEYLRFTASCAANLPRPTGPAGLRIVIDAGNGATSRVAPPLYRMLGYEVIELFCAPDGRFPNRPPNPALAENLTALGEKVRQSGAAAGVAFDGDGDRIGVVDEHGCPVGNDIVLSLLARHYLAAAHEPRPTVVYDAKCSMAVPEAIAEAGGRPRMARSGHAFVKEAFLREKALFAGELSGHFFFRELGYDDGMYAGLKISGLVRSQGPLADLAKTVPRYVLTPDIRLPWPGEEKDKIIEDVARKLAGYNVSRIDGVRVDFGDGWGMIRPSVTEPLLTLRFEAKTKGRLSEIIGIFAAALPEKIRAGVLPFRPLP